MQEKDIVLDFFFTCSSNNYEQCKPIIDRVVKSTTFNNFDFISLSKYREKYLSIGAVNPGDNKGQIYLYGEQHGQDVIINKEFDLWYDYYHKYEMRHLFMEIPYYTAEYLNIWMQSDNDEILNALYSDFKGGSYHRPSFKAFLEKIKNQCPETIFHGTDVGNYLITGQRFLEYLASNDMKNTEQYTLTEKALEQFDLCRKNSNNIYREYAMVENFIYEFDKLEDENVMGIYGYQHASLDSINFSVKSMGTQLNELYKEKVYSENLGLLVRIEQKVETYKVKSKEYQALYGGNFSLEGAIEGFDHYTYAEFYRLEDAYDDFSDYTTLSTTVPYSKFPFEVEDGQVFVIQFSNPNGETLTKYFRGDGMRKDNELVVNEFKLD